MIRAIAVDDDPMTLVTLEKLLSESGEIELVNSYESSIEGAAGIITDKPDVLFLDINMPEFDGFGIMKALVNPPKIVAMSANHDYRSQAAKLNAVAFLEKPFDQDSIQKLLEEVLQS